MSNLCAYCSSKAELTREHIVPSFLYKANPKAKFGFNPKADRFITWEAQIKDVCAKCNNEHLSELDGYANQFCLENHIDHLITDEKTISFIYNYSLLTRFLLKVTYNCLRFKGQDTKCIRPFSDFILYGVNRPTNLAAKLGVEITPCKRITESDRSHLPEELKLCEYLPPMFFRCGSISYPWSRQIFLRYVILNNFNFYVIVFYRSIKSKKLKETIENFRRVLPDITFLKPHLKNLTIKVSSTTALDRYADTAWALKDKWYEHIRR